MRTKTGKRKQPAAPACPPGIPLVLHPGNRVAVRSAERAVWLAVFEGWACEEKRFARVRYLHWDSSEPSDAERGIVPWDWLAPEPDRTNEHGRQPQKGDVGLTAAQAEDGTEVMMLARVLRVEGGAPVCRFLPRRGPETFEFVSGQDIWWPIQRFARDTPAPTNYLCVPTKQPSVEASDPRHREMFTASQLQAYDKDSGCVISQLSLCSTVRACPDKPPPSQP